MPRHSQRLASQRLDEDDEDDHPKSSQKSKRKGQKGKEDDQSKSEDISADIKTHKVDDVIRFCLSCNQNQRPIQRTDIVKNCLGKEYSNFFNDVFAEAKSKLRSIFGIDVLESSEKRGFYFLVNALPHTDFLKTSKEQAVTDALLYAVLSNIFMRNPEQKFVNGQCFNAFLSKLGIDLSENHRVFGDVKKLIYKTYVEQGWLEVSRKTNEDTTDELFAWGWRAYLVLRRGDMLSFVAAVLFDDGAKASTWVDHQAIAQREDEDEENGVM